MTAKKAEEQKTEGKTLDQLSAKDWFKLEDRNQERAYRRWQKRVGPQMVALMPELAMLIKKHGTVLANEQWIEPDIFTIEDSCRDIILGIFGYLWRVKVDLEPSEETSVVHVCQLTPEHVRAWFELDGDESEGQS